MVLTVNRSRARSCLGTVEVRWLGVGNSAPLAFGVITQALVITVGTFDGVHRGHAALVARAREIASAMQGRVLALVLDPHPLTVLRPEAAPARLSTFAQRRVWLHEAGADLVERIDPAGGVLALSPEAFVDRVIAGYGGLGQVRAWVEGPDFRFGKARAGDNALLAHLGVKLGFSAHAIEHMGVALSDQKIVPCRSDTIRWLLGHGRVFDAAGVLGRWYELPGTVVPGDRRGRTIGVPTANVRTEVAPPAPGVYAAFARLDDARVFVAAVNVGPRPTFDRPATIEAHLIGASATQPDQPWRAIEGLEEYGWGVSIQFLSYLRDTMRFSTVAGLREQLGRDIQRAQRSASLLAPSPTPTCGPRP